LKAIKDEKAKKLKNLTEKMNKEIKDAKNEFNIKKAVLDAGLSIDNFIYYTHSNEGAFNWKDFEKPISQVDFDLFLENVNKEGLPEGLVFKLKGK